MRFLRTNTAVLVTVGPFFDKTDGVTLETALTITNERITLTADTDDNAAPTNILDNVTGATSGTSNDLNYITGNDAGMMQLELSAANTNRLGRMLLSITDAANHVPVFHEFMVLPQAIYDWLIAGTVANLPVNTVQLSADTTAADNAEAFFDGTGYAGTGNTIPTVTTVTTVNGLAANSVTASALAADAAGEIADAVWDEDATGHQTQGTFGQAIGDPVADTDTIWGLVNTNLDAAVSTRATPAQVNTEADTALSDVGLTTTVTGRIDAAVTTRATPAQVNTEVLDVVTVDTFAEVAAVPAATSTLKDKINWLFALARNRLTQTASTQTLRNDANSADIATAAVADDGTTASRGEWV